MVNRDRILKEFMELVKIDSISCEERLMADTIKHKLESMGFSVQEDDTANKISGNAGNLICKIDGQKDIPPILLMAHMDTVTPGKSKKPIIDNDIVKSDGSTILGSDDLAGVACILETLRVIKEDNLNHGEIQVVFSVAEEIGLLGSKSLDVGKFNSKFAFILDGDGHPGKVSISAPYQNEMKIVMKGRAAHAGVEPEKGINAIIMASKAISSMKLGRIDEETTANVGKIAGGIATNIVCETVTINAEARSINKDKLDVQTEHMKKCFEDAAKEMGGTIEFNNYLMYPGFVISKDSEIIKIVESAAKRANIKLDLAYTGGGSDTNIMNSKGIPALNISVGMNKVHSLEENILINDLVNAAKFLTEICKSESYCH